MTEFAFVMRESDRMCAHSVSCKECPVGFTNNGVNKCCDAFLRAYPEKAESIIMQWSAKHPQRET